MLASLEIFLNNTTFTLESLIPVVILLGLSAIIPVILTVIRAKFIPVFVIEILAGILLASFGSRSLFVQDDELIPLLQGLYMIGMGILLFLSGLDTDFRLLKKIIKLIHLILVYLQRLCY